MRSFEIKVEAYAFNGEYRPLKFWEMNGYDPERIMANARPDEIDNCRMAGEIYKVPVRVDSKRTERSHEREESVASNGKKAKLSSHEQLAALFSGSSSAAPPADPHTSDSDSDSSSSSSSSSSSDHKKKNKKKKDKKKSKKAKVEAKKKKKGKEQAEQATAEQKATKLTEKLDAQSKAERRKVVAQAKKNADLVLKKSEKAYGAMNLIVSSPAFATLPLTATGGFHAVYQEIKGLRDSASEVRRSDDVSQFSFDLKNLEEKCKQGMKAEVLLRGILSQMALDPFRRG